MANISDVIQGKREAVRCPYPAYAQLQVAGGVYHDPQSDIFVVTHHALIAKVNTNPAVFSNQNPMGPTVMDAVHAVQRVLASADEAFIKKAELVLARGVGVLFTADPPVHTRHRKLLNKALTPKAVARIEPQVREACNHLIDGFADRGRVDLVPEYAVPAPVLALAILLGVPPERARDFNGWAEAINAAIGRSLTDDEVRNSINGQMEFWEFFEAEFADRMANPQQDLLTAVVNAREEGERPLTLDEMVSFASQFIGAGADTTSKLLAMGTYMLANDPSLAAQLRQDPGLIPRFIEEALRLESPVQGLFRLTTQDTELGGVPIPAGKYVWVVYAAANRDPDVFEDGDEFRLDRGRMPHYAFGHGPHSCIGSALARSVARIGFETLLERLEGIALAEEGAPADFDLNSFVMHGMRSLDLTFTKAGS